MSGMVFVLGVLMRLITVGFLIFLFGLLSPVYTIAQSADSSNFHVLPIEKNGADFLPLVNLKGVNVESKVFKDPIEEARLMKLKEKVIKVYPYAIMAREVLNNIDSVFDHTEKRRTIKRFKKSEEAELRAAFENDLKKLTISEGKILVKLINRYTGNSCLRLIKELKGPFYALIWKKVAKHYGYDLKEKYVHENEPDLEYLISTLESTFGAIEGEE